ncbi:MAG: molybdenum cofactor biosynthesis protein MoaE [Acidobacteria bacterium]|nr:MAG: molybdenum cofactor biosynthesis protein MoaE [Acidobacteriota bacterium]
MSVRVEIGKARLDPGRVLSSLACPADGAVNLFLGVVRDHHQSRRVLRLEYHAYGAMAKQKMQQIADEVTERFGATSVVLLHRLGTLEIGDVSVLVAVATAHRAESFTACRHAIERIKSEVPIWKKEHFEDGVAWVEGCRPGAPDPSPI